MANKTRLLLFATLLLAVGTSRAWAQNPFSIDGIVTDANNSGVAPGATKTLDQNGNVKELGPVNSSTTKIGVINSAPLPMLGTSNPNGQTDLNTVYTQSKVVGTDLWFYFGWVRDANSGSGFISIELQRSAVTQACNYATMTDAQLIANCNPWAGRQDNDAIILWDQSGSSTALTYRLYNSALQAFSAPVTIPTSIGVAQFSADGFRGEAAVNISALVAAQANQCLTFANIIPGTVTGNSDSADYKDTVLSRFPLASNCGVVKVTKETLNGAGTAFTGTGSEGPFPFTLTAGTVPIFGGSVDSDCGTGSSVNTCVGSLAAGGSFAEISDLLGKTTYTLVEGTIPAKWEKVKIVCGGVELTAAVPTFTVTAGQTTECTITNKLKQGKLIVYKVVTNNNGGTLVASDFTIDLNFGGTTSTAAGNAAGAEYNLNDGVTYSVDETTVPTGYQKTGLSTDCTGTIVANTTKECTVTNNDVPPSLTLTKVVHNNAGGTAQASAFTLYAKQGGVTILSGTGGATSGATFQAGTYDLSEDPVTGYSIEQVGGQDWVCTGGGTKVGNTITLGIGQSASCTITNQDAKATPTGVTTQRVRLFDKLTITGIRTGAATAGTVTFRVYSDSQCATQITSESSVAITLATPNSATSNGTAETSVVVEATGVGTQPKVFYWTAQYTGDVRNTGFTRGCGKETTTTNIQDDPGTP